MENYEKAARRESVVKRLGDNVWRACYGDREFFGNEPLKIDGMSARANLRSGMLEIEPGPYGGKLIKRLTSNHGAGMRNLFPRDWIGPRDNIAPRAYFSGRRIVIEAQWPPELATEMLEFSEINPRPGKGKSFTVGRDNDGDVTITLRGMSTNILVGGGTRSGKTTLLFTFLRQVCLDASASFVLINGKGRKGIFAINGLPGQVGPMAIDTNAARDAVGWVYTTMIERLNSDASEFPPLYLVFDEFDTFTMVDNAIAQMVFLIVKMGIEVNVISVLATQSPKREMFGRFGTATRAQLGIRAAGKVASYDESKVIIGATSPRADYLGGRGDFLIITDEIETRCLVAFTSLDEARSIGGGEPTLRRYPTFDASTIIDGGRPGPEPQPFSVEESLVGLRAVLDGRGRPWIVKRLQEINGRGMGSDRIRDKLLPHGEEMAKLWMRLETD